MKKYCFIVIVLFVTGCDLFTSRQDLVKANIVEADRLATLEVAQYDTNVRPVKTYEPYHYQHKIEDPFRVRPFLMTNEESASISPETNHRAVCSAPTCVPPKDHKKGFLENYSLDELAFVGTLMRDDRVALIRTPDLGVVKVKEGEYMGRRNGKVLAIKETAIILREKVYRGGLWEDKKVVLMITR